MQTIHTDVAIIGAGTAGLVAAGIVRKKTDRFVLIQDGPMGTTCARVGCMPSKALIQTANDFHRRTFFGQKGIRAADALFVNGAEVMRHVRALRDRFTNGMIAKTEGYGDKLIKGRARFLDANRLTADGQTIHAKRIIIATGSRPDVPDRWQALGGRILTSDTLFEIDALPESIAVVGLGVIGTELGQALARLGVKVVGVARSGRIAGLSDPEVTASATAVLSGEFELWSGHAAELSVEGENLIVTAGAKKKPVDAALVGTGRRPNVDDMGLERLGVKLRSDGVPDFHPDTLQVGDLPIFIAGDANGQTPILHEAWDDGRVAGYNAVSDEPAGFKRRAPLLITFTEPNIVIVGKTYAQLAETPFVVGHMDFEDQERARIFDENVGLMRLYADPERGRLLGGEMFAPVAEHLGHLLAWSIQQDLTVFDMLKLPFYHPVVEEGLRAALQHTARQVKQQPHFPEMDFS